MSKNQTIKKRVESMTAKFIAAHKVVFRGKQLPLFKDEQLPLIEDVAYWFEHSLRNKTIKLQGEKKPMTYLTVGHMYMTTTKQLWVITQDWISNKKQHMTARKLYPRRGEDHRLFIQGSKHKSSLGLNI